MQTIHQLVPKALLIGSIFLLCNLIGTQAQSVCGIQDGSSAEPGIVQAGTVIVPETAPTDGPDGGYSVVVDGSDYQLYEQPGEQADNNGPYPEDAILPEPAELLEGQFTSVDYEYVFTICPAGADSCFLRSTESGAINPANLDDDGTIDELPVGSTICVTGFTYSLGQFNYILELIANPIICGLLEPEFPEGITCDQIAELAVSGIKSVNDLLVLTSYFGYTANSVPEALYALGAIENLMIENGFPELTPCYAVAGWSDSALSTSAIINNAPAGSLESEILQMIADEWAGNAFCMTVIEVDMCPFLVAAGEPSATDVEGPVLVCSNDLSSLVDFENSGETDSEYAYIVASADGNTVYANFSESYNFFGYPEDTLRVYGFSYTGEFSLSGGAGLEGISASECAELSETYVEVVVQDCGGVGLETLGAGALQISPNPNNGQGLSIEVDAGVIAGSILDLQGRLVLSFGAEPFLDTAELNSGFYLLLLDTDRGKMQSKLIIQ